MYLNATYIFTEASKASRVSSFQVLVV